MKDIRNSLASLGIALEEVLDTVRHHIENRESDIGEYCWMVASALIVALLPRSQLAKDPSLQGTEYVVLTVKLGSKKH